MPLQQELLVDAGLGGAAEAAHAADEVGGLHLGERHGPPVGLRFGERAVEGGGPVPREPLQQLPQCREGGLGAGGVELGRRVVPGQQQGAGPLLHAGLQVDARGEGGRGGQVDVGGPVGGVLGGGAGERGEAAEQAGEDHGDGAPPVSAGRPGVLAQGPHAADGRVLQVLPQPGAHPLEADAQGVLGRRGDEHGRRDERPGQTGDVGVHRAPVVRREDHRQRIAAGALHGGRVQREQQRGGRGPGLLGHRLHPFPALGVQAQRQPPVGGRVRAGGRGCGRERQRALQVDTGQLLPPVRQDASGTSAVAVAAAYSRKVMPGGRGAVPWA